MHQSHVLCLSEIGSWIFQSTISSGIHGCALLEYAVFNEALMQKAKKVHITGSHENVTHPSTLAP